MSSNLPLHSAELHTHLTRLYTSNFDRSPVYAFLLSSIVLTHTSPGLIRARLKLAPNHLNSKGSLHGTVSACLVDWIGGLAIASHDMREKTGVSTDMHISFLSTARAGEELIVEGRADKVGGTLAFTSIRIWKVKEGDAEGNGEVGIVVTGSHTKFVKA